MDNIITILFAMYFCYRSFQDFSGDNKAIRVEYRELLGRKKWQKKKAVLEMVIGLGTILFMLFYTIKMVVIAVGTIVLLAFILMILNNKKYMRQSKTGDKP